MNPLWGERNLRLGRAKSATANAVVPSGGHMMGLPHSRQMISPPVSGGSLARLGHLRLFTGYPSGIGEFGSKALRAREGPLV